MVIYLMCGIIGCISRNAKDLLLFGLERMRYRGYDSCGIGYRQNNLLKTTKSLKEPRELKVPNLCFGIGHTRWATHGIVSLTNAHPIFSYDNTVLIVHNGIVENALELSKLYLKDITLATETDTEILVNMICLFSQKYTIIEAISKVLGLIKGTNAFLLIFKDSDDIYYASKEMNLIYSYNDEEFVIASDALALPQKFQSYYYLPKTTYGRLSNVCNLKNNLIYPNTLNESKTSQDYLFKEINEAPEAISIVYKNFLASKQIKEILNYKSITFIASGSSYNASLLAAYFLTKYHNIVTFVKQSSEFAYGDTTSTDLYIFISQSGQTADTIKAARLIKDKKKILTITNNKKSTLATMGSYHFDLALGEEVSVASTKAYLASVYLFYLLATDSIKHSLTVSSIERVLKSEEPKKLASCLQNDNYLILLAKNISYYISQEAMLKLKELCYLHVDTYYAGELKHGPLALCTQNVKIILLNLDEKTNLISRNNLKEAQSRKATTYILSSANSFQTNDYYLFSLNNDEAIFEAICFYQLLAYYLAKIKNNNPDRPRNLAKSVTVE